MIREVKNKNEINDAIGYVGENYKSTPYLYVNIIKYGLGTKDVHAWIDWNESMEIEGIYLLYYDCIHFYTNDISGYPINTLIDFIKSTDHRVVMVQGGIGDRLNYEMIDYLSERNYVIDMDKCGLENKKYYSEIANRNDISEIVELLISDPEYIAVYDREVLSKQLYDRFDSNFSRYFVVKMDGKVVATCSTYGEVDGFALVGGTIVHPEYRRKGLGGDVENYACHVLEKEGKSRVGFVNYNNTASLALHERIGAYNIATLAKFVRRTGVQEGE